MKTNDLQGKAQAWQGEAEEAVHDLKSRVQEKAGELKELVQDWKRHTAETSRKAAKAADGYVHENPWTVMGCVAVASLLLGFILGRSRD